MSDQVSGQQRRALVVKSVVVASGLLFIVLVAIYPTWVATGLMTDDAFYYLTIAKSIVHGFGSSFDGTEPTNGYHPLWMVVAVAVQWLAGDDRMLAVRLFMTSNCALALCSVLLIYKVTKRFLAPGLEWLAVALCLLPTTWMGMTNGLETGLMCFVIVFMSWVMCRYSPLSSESRPATMFLFGVLLGVLFLSRLDSVFVPLAVGCCSVLVAVFERSSPRRLLLRGAALVLGFGIVATPYVAWNIVRFGKAMPISGVVKSTLPSIRSSLLMHTDMAFGLLLVLAMVACAATVLVVGRRRRAAFSDLVASPVIVLALAATLHFVHAWLFLDWGVYWWHFSLAAMSLPMAVPCAIRSTMPNLEKHTRLLRVGFVTGAVGLLACVVAIALIVRNKGIRHVQWLAGAEWARSHTPSDAVFAIKDAGLFSYFADRTVYNLDGKASGLSYLEALKTGQVLPYLRSRRVSFVADIECHYDGETHEILLPRAGGHHLWLLMPKHTEVYRSSEFPHRLLTGSEASTAFTIWRFDAEAIRVR